MGLNKNEKLGISNRDILLKPEPFIVNKQHIEILEKEKKFVDLNESDDEMYDFTQQKLVDIEVTQDVNTSYAVKAIGT